MGSNGQCCGHGFFFHLLLIMLTFVNTGSSVSEIDCAFANGTTLINGTLENCKSNKGFARHKLVC